LAESYFVGMDMDSLAGHLAANVRQLRDARRMTQQQMARLSGLPRATWSNLESGSANPTLAVLHRVADALQVSLEELLAAPRTASRFHPRGSLPQRTRTEVTVRQLLPDPIPGSEIGRMEFAPLARLTGIPHTPGTREYLTCESGRIELVVAGEKWVLEPGDVVSFRGDQRHSYANPGRTAAVGYSVVLLAPIGAR
jgi:transcriptional regulator with XRE-family HTH domain